MTGACWKIGAALMLTVGPASPHVEIDVGSKIFAMTFTANGEYLISGGSGVRVWRVKDGEEMATMEANGDIAERNYRVGLEDLHTLQKDELIRAVDFSPDSTRLVSGSGNKTAIVWDITRGKQVQTLRHNDLVTAAKYSPLAANDGPLLVDISVKITTCFNGGLCWFNNHLFVIHSDKIKEFDASTGSAASEWSVPSSDYASCITLSQNGEFIAYSTTGTVTFWDTSTLTQLVLIDHPRDIHSISPDDRFIAIGGLEGNILITSLSGIIHLSSLSALSPTFEEPDTQVDDVALDSPKDDQVAESVLDSRENDKLAHTEASLAETIVNSRDQTHHALAKKACLGHPDLAIEDAENSIKIRPSVNGYIAKSVAFIGAGKKAEGCRVYDLAFKHCNIMDVDLILLIKVCIPPAMELGYFSDTHTPQAIVVFMAGEHWDAISRVDDLIATVQFNSICFVAYMYLLIGNVQLENINYEGAIQSFERARSQMRSCVGTDLPAISLISGWKFDGLDVTIQQRLCDALYAAGRRNDAGESLLKMVNILDQAVYMSGPLIKWVSDWTHRYLSAPEGDAASNSAQQHETPDPTPLLAKATLANSEWKDALIAAGSFTLPRVTTYQAVCERLVAINRVTDAIDCFHEMMSESEEEVYVSGSMTDGLLVNFTQRCLSAPKSEGETASDATGPLLKAWAKAKLTRDPWEDVLASAVNFTVPRVTVYRAICERLETIDRITDAFECVKQLTTELGGENHLHGEHLEWVHDFRQRSSKKLEYLGDIAAVAHRCDDAIFHYTTALSLNGPSPQDLLIKRSKAFLATRSLLFTQYHQAVTLDPSSPWGYEMKRAALHETGDYDNAVDAFEVMLSKMVESPDPDVQQHGDQFISPSSTRATIHKIVQRTTRHLPRVLINTTTGHLHDRAQQAATFETLPIFNELVSSTTTRIDYVRIKREVRQYFRYMMLSHKWEDNEPLFQQVVHMAVYDLDQSPTHDKLQMFCKIVQDAGFDWAWSDTCCINKSDHFVLQEALVAMFKWYQDSAMMIVFLRGVRSSSRRGALAKSIWNTRGWTLQEYIASKVIHFYTEDWTPYLDLALLNHRESPEIISEMEEATGVSAQQLMALRSGLTSIREKLCLASTRQTTEVEDAAYSLLDIFSVTGLPAIYGAREGALGHLLALVLTGSGDVSILAWTGDSGSYNSCLPAHITVFNESAMSHLPTPIPEAEMERIVTTPDSSSFDLDVVLRLYDRLNELSAPWFAENRMKPPCIAFQLPPLRARPGRVYRADTVAFGTVEIKTRQDLSRMKTLYLIHPWLDTILDHDEVQSGVSDHEATPPLSLHSDDEEVFDEDIDNESLSVPEPESPTAPVRSVSLDRETRARRLVARLGQPFGALLLTVVSAGRRVVDYRRVAADSLITVQIQENVSLADLLDNVCTLDVL
ncbi:WD40 repeat-like protein [Imleria badia]|nr:WD40 repeat-like protein [Imleria badia]